MDLLNSELVQWIMKLAFSRSGVVIRWLVGYIMGALLATNIIPSGDSETIQFGLTSGLTTVAAIAYAGFNYWINARQKKGVLVVQELIGANKSGVVGNGTITAVAEATGKGLHDVHQAITNINGRPPVS
jgi:hypothetical protein